MQNYTQIPDSQRVSDSLAPLLNNDLTAISRNAGDSFPINGLQIGMPYLSTSQNKLFRLTSLTPVTWVVEIDYNRTIAYQDSIDALSAAIGTRVSKSGDSMTGPLTLSGDPSQALHATPKRYVDAQAQAATTAANNRVLRSGDQMTGPLTLSGDPSQPYHAATKNYADYLYNSLNNAKLGRNGDTVAELYNNGWFRSNGQVGWYNQTYGGGIHMSDFSYVRVYGGKGFATDTHTLEQGTGGIWTSRYGWLENCFAGKGAEDRLNSVGTTDGGDGWRPGGFPWVGNGVIAPQSFYLQRSGSQVQLVRVWGNCNCNCACTCFPAGTRIMMADGSWEYVEKIKVGDMVMTPLGPEAVLDVETPLLGDRKMVSFEDRSFFWTDDHAFWTRRDGAQAFGVVDKQSWMRGVELGVVKGLPNNDDVRLLDDRWDEFAHIDGWQRKRVVKHDMNPNTKVYLPIVGGCHMIIAEGYVVSAGANGFDFDYNTFDWKGLDHARA
ncbi:shufflon system plasmid conjugative transfer pilus tip adhesin PilV [Burkholderia territorii]|uniref:shufflon system plasmid conjugative transfer pilus tip adhesin PilV n=1 Tax=Burkholderia territorii TaxID=1503055 RepID=UPI00075B2B8A|nr:shufflon system plasmid conjugative transfer pilus tip adhesin PilV [Burkholderia territorii]KVL49954.1 hypothetical protein WT00_18565 [Burkholderia territorii]